MSTERQLVLLQGDICVFSWSVGVHGKAQFAGNGRRPSQELQHSQGRRQANSSGTPVASRRGVAALDKDRAIACAPRLAAKRRRGAESVNITLQEYWRCP